MSNTEQQTKNESGRKWVSVVVALVGLGAVGGGIFGLLSLGGGGSDDRVAAASTTVAAADPVALTTVPPTTIVTGETTIVPVATEPPTTVAAPTTTVSLIDPAAPIRWAEFTGGKVYLQGVVPDQATADELRDKAAGVVGPDNVVVQYQIVPGAARPPSAPLYVRDSALFTQSSTDLDATARGVLDLGVALMTQNPAVTIDIHGYTDSDGDEATNLALSKARVDAMILYLLSKGIDPARLTATAHGEADPVADNATPEGRAKNRRVEFTVNNLLG
jgi:outer membrane protein OmpA-like peptidoglycan-associated protein